MSCRKQVITVFEYSTKHFKLAKDRPGHPGHSENDGGVDSVLGIQLPQSCVQVPTDILTTRTNVYRSGTIDFNENKDGKFETKKEEGKQRG